MIKSLVFILLGATALLAQAQNPGLQGKWKGSTRADISYIIFGADSSISIINGKDTAAAEYIYNDTVAYTRFTVDTSSKPMHLNMYIISSNTKMVISTAKFIYEFMGPDKIRIRMSGDDGERPKSFLPKGNPDTMILSRVKK